MAQFCANKDENNMFIKSGWFETLGPNKLLSYNTVMILLADTFKNYCPVLVQFFKAILANCENHGRNLKAVTSTSLCLLSLIVCSVL